MKILDAFNLSPEGPELICLVGGGGKTTTMFALAQALKTFQRRVLVTTTTNILYPGKEDYDRIIVDHNPQIAMFQDVGAGTVTVLGDDAIQVTHETKLTGVDKGFIDALFRKRVFDHILVEADGSKQKPIKAPAHYEPVIPGNTTMTIGVIGLDAAGKPIAEEYVHRPELFCQVVKRRPGDLLDEETLVTLILSPRGLFQGIPVGCRRFVLLNKAEDASRKQFAENVVSKLQRSDHDIDIKCVIAAMGYNKIYSPAGDGL